MTTILLAQVQPPHSDWPKSVRTGRTCPQFVSSSINWCRFERTRKKVFTKNTAKIREKQYFSWITVRSFVREWFLLNFAAFLRRNFFRYNQMSIYIPLASFHPPRFQKFLETSLANSVVQFLGRAQLLGLCTDSSVYHLLSPRWSIPLDLR